MSFPQGETRPLYPDDLALARACAEGDEAAWERFVAEYRPILNRAAAAMDPAGGQELADSIYAELYGLRGRDGKRRSLFLYFHGRSKLSTWLRAVLAQRHVDAIRARRRTEPLPDDESASPLAGGQGTPAPERSACLDAMERALAGAVAALPARERLRLRCYYLQEMTLAEIGTLLGEHEASVSRHLTRTRGTIREAVERDLRDTHGWSEAAIAECVRAASDDPGALDLRKLLRLDRSHLEKPR